MNHHEAEELLPWFVNGGLDPEEHRAVQAFVDSGEITQRQIDEIKLVREVVQRQRGYEPAYDSAILDRAFAQLDATEQIAAQGTDSPLTTKPAPGLLQRLYRWFDWHATPRGAKVALAAQFGLVLALGIISVAQFGASPTTPERQYSTVSGSTPGTVRTGDLLVTFADDVSEADLRNLLHQFDIQIVNGPNSLGMYALKLPDAVPPHTVMAALRDDPRTKLVEPVEK